MELLLDEGVLIDHQDESGDTVLHLAVSCWVDDCDNDCVDFLLKRGINWNIRNENGESALHVAVFYQNVEGLKLMLENIDFDINKHVNNVGNSLFHFVE